MVATPSLPSYPQCLQVNPFVGDIGIALAVIDRGPLET